MNYRTHISVPSANRVEVSVPGRPELARLIELPSDAPREWLAHAYLLSIGMDADARDLDDLEPPPSWDYNDWDRFLGPRATYHPVSRERMRLPGLPGLPDEVEVELEQRGAFRPQVGDQKVAVHKAEHTTSQDRSAAAWQVSPPPFLPDAVNHELARKYGVVLPHFNSSVLDRRHHGWGSTPLIDSLLAALSPVRRIALRAHLDEIGLFDEAKHPDGEGLREAAQPLLHVLAAIGPDGAEQDPETGWLPLEFAADLASDLGWEQEVTADAVPGDLLVSVARRAKLIRRLRGRVVTTAAARKLVGDPAREIVKVLMPVLTGDDRDRYDNRSTFHIETAAAVLAIADGSAQTFDDLAGLVELAATARKRRREDEYGDEYAWHEPDDESTRARRIALAVESVVEGFSVLSVPHAFGEISSAMRAVARVMLTGS
ncbi:hypothetical protein QF046_002048 [Microbacterium sp. W4I4]|uniref:hypothetical protein n=1 Tax=Microbacterium sp. W4I4 TaxID=3042295 RepID=UPI00278165BD|nr:hypothetical protein [Microbacterium sp. W4I4]MDQ0614407.1 hypothetical protein [Microbacterium sp. W4I4]